MAQFKVGKASVTQGQQAVFFTDASLVGNGSVTAGNLFSITGENVWYEIESVAVVSGSLTQVVLKTPYSGATKSDRSYAIHRNFSTNLNLPLSEYGDTGSGELLGLSLNVLDSTLAMLGGTYGPISGAIAPIFTLRQNTLEPLEVDAGLSIHREGLSPIIFHYTASAPWKRWSLGDADLGTNGRVGIGRAPAGSEKLAVAGNVKIDGSLDVVGDLTVSGNTLTLDVENLSIEDAVITLAHGNTSDAAPFIGLKAERGGNDSFLVFDKATNRWAAYVSSDDLVSKTFGTIQANLVGDVDGNANSAARLQTARTISISQDATGSVAFDGSTNANIVLTLANTGVGAGTFTKVTVDAKGRVTAGSALTSLDVTQALAFTPFAPADAANANVGNKLVLRDGAGGFAAGAITATSVTATQFNGDLLGTAQAAGKLFSARTISIGTDASGSVAFDGSANVTLGLTLAASGVTPGTYSNIVVDAKGRLTSARALNNADVVAGLGYNPLNTAGGTISGNLTVTGDLTVQGTLTQFNTTIIEVDDPIITVGKGNSSVTAPFLGLKMERSTHDVFMVWDEASDRFQFAMSTDELTANKSLMNVEANAFYGALVGNAATATKLAVARSINGVAFDGTTNISFSTDLVVEGATNRYFTEARARAAFTAGSGIVINQATGQISVSASAPVTSVAGRTGDVVLQTSDIVGLGGALSTYMPIVGGTFSGTIAVRGNATHGFVSLVSGISGNPGYVAFTTEDDVRRGYIGWSNSEGRLNITAENGWGWNVFGDIHFNHDVLIKPTASLSFGNASRQMLNLWGTAIGLGVQSNTLYARVGPNDTFAIHAGGSHVDTFADPGAGGTLLLAVNTVDIRYKNATIWHAGNFDPASKPDRTGSNIFVGTNEFRNSEQGGIAQLAGGKNGVMISAEGNHAATIAFHRYGAFAGHLGLDIDNNLRWGGWSLGANSYLIWHSGNFDPASKVNLRGMGSIPYEAVNLNTSLTVHETRFVNPTGSAGLPVADMGYYMGFGGGDNANRGAQLYVGHGTKKMFFRVRSSGETWEAWEELLRKGEAEATYAKKSGQVFTGAISAPEVLSIGSGAILKTVHRDDLGRQTGLYATGGKLRLWDGLEGDLAYFDVGGLHVAPSNVNGTIRVGTSGAVFQSDGNLYMPWASAYLSTVLNNKLDKTGGSMSGDISAPGITSTGTGAQVATQHRDNLSRVSLLYANASDTYLYDSAYGHAAIFRSNETHLAPGQGATLRWGNGGANLANNGDLYMPWAGSWLSVALEARLSKTGGLMTGALEINYGSPSLWLHYPGVKRARFVVDAGGTLVWQDQGGQNHFYVTSSGAMWTQQLGDLNTRIEDRAYAWAESKRAEAVNTAFGWVEDRVYRIRMSGYGESGENYFVTDGPNVVTDCHTNGAGFVSRRFRTLQKLIPNAGWVNIWVQ